MKKATSYPQIRKQNVGGGKKKKLKKKIRGKNTVPHTNQVC